MNEINRQNLIEKAQSAYLPRGVVRPIPLYMVVEAERHAWEGCASAQMTHATRQVASAPLLVPSPRRDAYTHLSYFTTATTSALAHTISRSMMDAIPLPPAREIPAAFTASVKSW